MLKIIDDFDLEKLKDYGFEVKERYGLKFYSKNMSKISKDYNSEFIEINTISREINIYIDDEYYAMKTKNETLCELFDLFKLGIVEKVSDEDE